jgi:hypothetical protein
MSAWYNIYTRLRDEPPTTTKNNTRFRKEITMKINYTNRTIEITKAFANKAKVYGSNEYSLLKEARKDNEGFAVVVVEAKRKTSKNSKITLADMERYISFHDDEAGSKMKTFEGLKNAKKNGELRDVSFFEIKKWFFETFKEVA